MMKGLLELTILGVSFFVGVYAAFLVVEAMGYGGLAVATAFVTLWFVAGLVAFVLHWLNGTLVPDDDET